MADGFLKRALSSVAIVGTVATAGVAVVSLYVALVEVRDKLSAKTAVVESASATCGEATTQLAVLLAECMAGRSCEEASPSE